MTEKTDLTLRGVAIRGERLKTLDELSHGVRFRDEDVTLRTARDHVVGTARLNLSENGDVVVEATVPDEQVLHLVGSPYLCVAAHLNENAPADLDFILLSPSTEDPFERPYRITGFDPSREKLLRREGYRPVRVVTEATLVELSLNADGELEPGWDEEKTHVEWEHVTGIDQHNITNAVVRGFNRATWDGLDEAQAAIARRVLTELQRLGLRGHR